MNIKEREGRGSGAAKQILNMLNDLCLGEYHFEVANILRSSLLLSTLLSNSESWYNLSKVDVSKLESVDEELLRKVLSAHSKTPKVLLYLETGNIPLRFTIQSRRMNFLWYILNEEDNSLIKTFFMAQYENPSKGDWVSQIQSDLIELGINYTFDQIRQCSKLAFKKLVKERVTQNAFKYLCDLQGSYTKGRDIKYSELKLQDYLKSNQGLSIKEKSFIFAARSNMINVKCNFKIGKPDLICEKCHTEEETQKHILFCKAISDSSVLDKDNIPEYEDLYSKDPKKIALIGRILLQKFNNFNQVHRPSPSAAISVNNVNNVNINALVELE